MARRSSRLRNSHTTPAKSANDASDRLDSVAEHEETPTSGAQYNLDAIVSSPLAPRTPATGRVKAPKDEMHPSKAQHSTTQEPDSGLRLGFTDIEAKGSNLPSGVTQQSPSKTGISSSFDFRFARPGPQLGPEAQRMMNDLREDALRIKARFAADREEEKRKAEALANTVGGRKFAHPKGKVGRFSDVHLAEFKRMDSIAGHASAYRAQPGRFTPATVSLKRTQSRAQLVDKEDQSKNGQSSGSSDRSERLENTAPAKRVRKNIGDDTSSARPVSRGIDKPLPTTPVAARQQSSLLASLTTPTQASLARASSAKKAGSQIPTLVKSPSKPNLNATPRGIPKSARRSMTAPRPGIKGILRSPGKFDRMKSILRHPSSTIKKSTPSSIPSLARSPSKPNLEKTILPAPSTPGGQSTAGTRHAMFNSGIMSQNSPSPVKSGIPRSTSKISFGTKLPVNQAGKSRPQLTSSRYPQLPRLPNNGNIPAEVEYPSLASVRPLLEPARQSSTKSKPPPPSVPGTFTFRSDQTISFGKTPEGFGSSPSQASVRQVRPSIFPMPVPGSFPDSNKENTKPLPSVPHGMSNKKRRRVDSDDEQDEEIARSPKKHKSAAAEGQMLMAPRIEAEKMASMSQFQSPSPTKKKGVLSLSRLNMLARPKMRK